MPPYELDESLSAWHCGRQRVMLGVVEGRRGGTGLKMILLC